MRVGDPAPDFNWVGADGQTRRLRDLLDHAHSLVVFAPSDEVLRDLERERETLGLMGVVPLAVIEARPRSAAVRARRTDSHFLLVPDPVRVVGAQFDMIDSNTNRLVPGWFAIDRRGNVRGMGMALEPPQGWARIAASALAIPSPDATVPVKTR